MTNTPKISRDKYTTRTAYTSPAADEQTSKTLAVSSLVVPERPDIGQFGNMVRLKCDVGD